MMMPEFEVVWVPHPRPDRPKVVCVKLIPDSPLLMNAANNCDAVMEQVSTRSRQESEETDVTMHVMQLVRSAGRGWQSEGSAAMLELDGIAAIGMGSNIKHRRRAAWVAFAVAHLIAAADRRQVTNDSLRRLMEMTHMKDLADKAWRARNEPMNFPSVTDPPGGSLSVGAQPAQAMPRAGTAEEMQSLARGLGALECCVQDPYMYVDANNFVLCAACNKHFTPEHLTTRRHLSYLDNKQGTVNWLLSERKPMCVILLQLSEQNRGVQANSYNPPEPEVPESIWGDSWGDAASSTAAQPLAGETPGSWEERAELAEPEIPRWSEHVELPPVPTNEENWDFAYWLVPSMVLGLRKDLLVFNEPIGLEEV